MSAAQDRREIALYSLGDAEAILHMSRSLTAQCVMERLVVLPASRPLAFSFSNIVALHALAPFLRNDLNPDETRTSREHIDHTIDFSALRTSLCYVEQQIGENRPLIHLEFQTYGIPLFIERFSSLVGSSLDRRGELTTSLVKCGKRISFDSNGIAARLFPFGRSGRLDDPVSLELDPLLSDEKICVARSSTGAEELSGRFLAGETIRDLAREFQLTQILVEDAIRWCDRRIRTRS